jgi:hypothetical protein
MRQRPRSKANYLKQLTISRFFMSSGKPRRLFFVTLFAGDLVLRAFVGPDPI